MNKQINTQVGIKMSAMKGKNVTLGKQRSSLIWSQAAKETGFQCHVATECDSCPWDGILTHSCAFDRL